MRDVKFRGVNPTTGGLMDVCAIDWMHDEVYFEQGSDVAYEIGDCELMQYTGYKDKNSVELCAGDIVKCRISKGVATARYIGIVKWSDVYCAFVVAGVKQYFGDKRFLHELYVLEVIGNIYQNPEMIE